MDLEKLVELLLRLKIKKVILYGTGINARLIVEQLKDIEIVGVLDRTRIDGVFMGYPIVEWDDIKPEKDMAIVVSSRASAEREIFRRIMYWCKKSRLKVLSCHAEDLFEKYLNESLFTGNIIQSDRLYFKKDARHLTSLIDNYDAVSFDLFDTLIMRKTIDPLDIFDVVEERLLKKDIVIKNFRKKRRTAELEIGTGTIDDIYVRLSQMYDIDEAVADIIKDEELKCEMDMLVTRSSMVQIMEYAFDRGKIVSIISDMYLSKDRIQGILSHLGIEKYHNILVSCDYGCAKGGGLFLEYLKLIDVSPEKCIHIGDNYEADVISPQRKGIFGYEVKSSYSLLDMSNIRELRELETDRKNRRMLGIVVERIFNDPFALAHSYGFVTISTVEQFIKLCVAPIVFLYLSKLKEYIAQYDFQAILFGARDGFLFNRIIRERILDGFDDIKTVYFYTSRRAALTSSVFSTEDWNTLKKYTDESEDSISEHFFCIKEKDEAQRLKKVVIESDHKRSNYIKYLQKEGLSEEGNYLICDLISSGTVQWRLNKIFTRPQKGFYLWKIDSCPKRDIDVYSVLGDSEDDIISQSKINLCINLLEKILTSFEGTVKEFDDNGEPLLSYDNRSEDELETVKRSHEYVVEWIRECVKDQGRYDISKEVAFILLCISQKIDLTGEASVFQEMTLIDDMSGKRLRLWDL